MVQITSNNILQRSVVSADLDSAVVNNLNTANTANTTGTNATTLAQAAFNQANTNASSLNNLPPSISNLIITDSSFNNVTHTSTTANTTGDFCSIFGSGFIATPNVFFNTTSASAVTFVNSTTLRVTIPTLASANYPVYVVNSGGATAMRIPGLRTSTFPSWTTGTTLTNATVSTAYSNTLVATSNSTITYSNTTALPAGLSLAPSTGVISGTPTVAATNTFTILATDAEGQANARTFSLTVA